LLEQNDNLERSIRPGDVNIAVFKGQKTAFAERMSVRFELHPHFQSLVKLIESVLGI